MALTLQSLRALSERERRVLIVGGAIAALLFVFAVIVPLDRSVSHLRRTVVHKQSDLAWMRRVAPEIAAAGPAPQSTEPLIVVVNESARTAGLGGTLTGTSPTGTADLSVQLRQAPFDRVVAWLARLQQQNGVQVHAATFSTAGPGLVDASVDLGTP